MKPKDLICIVGAPVKTAIEIPLMLSMVFVGVGLFAFIAYIFGVMVETWLHGWFHFNFYGMGSEVILPAILLLVVSFILIAGFVKRTTENYDACKAYWNP